MSLLLIDVDNSLMYTPWYTRGITYNPSLALRQFGYAQRDDPYNMLIQGIIFNYENDPQNYHQRFIHVLGAVNKIDSKTFGHKNSIPLEPYLRCPLSHCSCVK